LGARVKRREDWPVRLAEALEAARETAFAWGVHDCAIFAFGCVRAMTDADLFAPWRGVYDSALSGAKKVLVPNGGLAALAGKLLETESAPLAFAQRGDLVSVLTVDGPALGVCLGDRAVFVGPEGLVFVPMTQCEARWPV